MTKNALYAIVAREVANRSDTLLAKLTVLRSLASCEGDGGRTKVRTWDPYDVNIVLYH